MVRARAGGLGSHHALPAESGWWLALGHLITGIVQCVTIIGIPLGLANFKMIPISLTPLGRDIVSTDQATGGTSIPSSW